MKNYLGSIVCCILLMAGDKSFSSETSPSSGINLLNRLVQERIVGSDSSRLSVHAVPARPLGQGPVPTPAGREPEAASASTTPEAAMPAQSAAQINDLAKKLNDAQAQKKALEGELAALRSTAGSRLDSAALRELERASKSDRDKAAALAGQLAEAAAQNAALEKQLAALKTSGSSDKQKSAALAEDLKKAGAEIAGLKQRMADLQAQKKPPAKNGTASVAQGFIINDTTSKDARTSYAVGVWYGDSTPHEMKKFSSIGRKLDLPALAQGFYDRVNNRTQLPQDKIAAELANVDQLLATAMLSENQKQSKAIMDKAAQEKGAVKTPDGAVYKILSSGKKPLVTDQSNILFDLDEELGTGEVLSSAERGSSSVKDLPPLFQVVVKKLGVGGSAKMYIPGEQIYGESGIPGVAPPGVLAIMTIKVVDIK